MDQPASTEAADAVVSPFPDGELTDAAELGAVDHQSVRVWVRQPDSGGVEGRLEVEGRSPVTAAIHLDADTDWTGALELRLAEPGPDAPFRATVNGRVLTGRLSPLPETHAGVTFAFGSCHLPFEQGPDGNVRLNAGAGLYPAMLEELRREDARFTLLTGDQIYSDHLLPAGVLADLRREDGPPPLDAAIAAYRRVYRGFFAERGLRALRQALPAYCTWDDHDILNDWGSVDSADAFDQRLYEAACRTYGEYQQTRNPGGAIGPPPYHYTFRHGDLGFLVLDLRGARDYDEGRLLGAAQWQAVRGYLHGDGAATVQTLFVVSCVPVAHVSRWFVTLFNRLPGDHDAPFKDRWCSAGFVESRDQLLEELFAWQTAQPRRQVILLSGDVHCASAFTLRQRHGAGVIRQFTSSALSTPPTRKQMILNRVAVQAPNLFEPDMQFRRHFVAFGNNFGLVRARPLPRGGHRVEFEARVWDPARRSLRLGGRVVSLPPREPGHA